MRLSLDKKRLLPAFLICFFMFMILPIVEPQWRFSFFAPFLIIAIYQRPLTYCLWLGILCGLILDLFSSLPHFGIYALDISLTIFLLYPQKRNFFADNISTLPIMTFFFGVISTVILAALVYVIEMQNVVSAPWVITDIILLPAIDSLYSFTCFTLPSLLFGQKRRRGKDYFTH